MSQTISREILIVDPSPLFREGLRQMLAEAGLALAEPQTSLAAAEAELARGRAGLLLLGYSGDGGDLCQELEAIKQRHPGLKVAVICDRDAAALLPRFCAAGVDSVLTKDISADRLARCLELIQLGQRILPNDWIDQMLVRRRGAAANDDTAGAVDVPLSEREQDIALGLAEGLPNKLIARRLGITEATVKVHVKGLLRKIHARNRTQAAIWAVRRETILPAPAMIAAAE